MLNVEFGDESKGIHKMKIQSSSFILINFILNKLYKNKYKNLKCFR